MAGRELAPATRASSASTVFRTWNDEEPTVKVGVEVRSEGGIPGIALTGMDPGTWFEIKHAMRMAFREMGIELPRRRYLVKVEPADFIVSARSIGLAVAAAFLSHIGKIDADRLEGCMLVGDLMPDGALAEFPTDGPERFAELADAEGLALVGPAQVASKAERGVAVGHLRELPAALDTASGARADRVADDLELGEGAPAREANER